MQATQAGTKARTAVLTQTSTLRAHRDADLIPEMREAEYRDLLQDIREHGIKVPIEATKDGTVLDGRHRLKIARELGIEMVDIVTVEPEHETPKEYMLKAAVLRRHLSDDQRAMMAAMYAKENPEATGKASQNYRNLPGTGRGDNKPKRKGTPAQTKAAALMNVSPNRTEKAAMVASKAPALAKKVHAGEMKLGAAIREVRHREIVKRIEEMPSATGKYNVIVADPPWTYGKSHDGLRGICPYPSMTLEEIKALDVPAADDCVLWLWTTNAHIPEAVEVVRAWGFEWKTMLTWVKDRIGLGDWLRGQTEHCVMAVRGNPAVRLKAQSTMIEAKAREHSSKPEAFYALVETLCVGNRLEMFARDKRAGWKTWGAEVCNRAVKD